MSRDEIKSPKILIFDFELKDLNDAVKLLDQLVKIKEPVVIFCKWIADEPLTEFIYNVNKKILDVSVVCFIGSDIETTNNLEDLGCLFNAKVFTKYDMPELLAGLDTSHLGHASKVEIAEHETFFVTSEDKSESHRMRIEKRLRDTEFLYRTSETLAGRQLLEERVNRLSGLLALIKIGGDSKVEQQEIKDKLTDGLNAVRNTLEYGALPGGGAALVHASKILDMYPREADEDFNNGILLLKECIRAPMRAIISNGGLASEYYVKRLLEEEVDPWTGFCLNSRRFGDMMDLGIIDSFHNLRNILIDAVSIGSMLLTTECVVYRNKRYRRRLAI